MRILLVEDNLALAESLLKALTQAGFAVDAMHDGQDADHVLHTQDYALVILDLALPRLDGWEVLRRLRARRKSVPVLILTAHGSVEDRVRGLDMGADDYLSKPFDLVELEARVRALIRRSHGHDHNLLMVGGLSYDGGSRVFTLAGQALKLTPREHAVLELLMLQGGKAISKDALSERIFGLDESGSAEAMEIYVHRLRKKLAHGDVGIVTLRGLGYLLARTDGGDG
ncbi:MULTISPECIES: response regulator [Chromobacteriaceae]|uniref:Response regulator n=2 Tax=Chromobacteriaceae TaxID=1499392 RepID=A0ABV0CFT0_9NEIS|nr:MULTISPECIES: response regulator [Chromobacteriaceae]AVG18343.1 DNA-binding response regulator [Chromobacterium vaccinii]ERD99519.1 transcriptional regulator [Pseudogulbenkiania ferrooxidans EGD-HP2]